MPWKFKNYEAFFACHLLCISYFDCVINATAWKVKVANMFVKLIIWCKRQDKNPCQLQSIWEYESSQRSLVTLSKMYG